MIVIPQGEAGWPKPPGFARPLWMIPARAGRGVCDVKREYPKNAPADQSSRTVLRSRKSFTGSRAGTIRKRASRKVSWMMKNGVGSIAGIAAPDESCATNHGAMSE